MKTDTIIYWVRSVSGDTLDLVPMYYKGMLTRVADEGSEGDIRARPVRLGRGPYTATYASEDFVDEDGVPVF